MIPAHVRSQVRLYLGPRFGCEVIERPQTDYRSCQCGGDGRLSRIRQVNYAVDRIVVHLEREGRFDLRDVAVERDLIAAIRHLDIGEALGLQPIRDLGDVIEA